MKIGGHFHEITGKCLVSDSYHKQLHWYLWLHGAWNLSTMDY